MDLLVIGETLVDLVPGTNGREAVLGGSPYNVAIGLARLGAKTALATSLSSDADGQRFKEALTSDGVDLSSIATINKPSPTALVEEGTKESGPRYVFTLNGTAFDEPAPVPQPWPDSLQHIHAGSIAAILGPMADTVLDAFTTARPHRTTSYDPNIRPMITPDREETRRKVEARVALADIVKASEEDLEWLYPEYRPHEAALEWLARGPRLVVLTRGSKGAEAFTAKYHLVVPAPAIKVGDTVGAGDSLMAALLFAMHRDEALGATQVAWTQRAIGKWLSFAVRAAAFTCTQKGANPPRLKDLER